MKKWNGWMKREVWGWNLLDKNLLNKKFINV